MQVDYITISGHLSELKLNNNYYNAHLTSDQFKASCDILSCTQSSTSGSSLVLSKFNAKLGILLQAVNNCCSFQI